MERKIVRTADGSTTIYLPEWDEHYHSKHGALQEAYHVFIRSGLDLVRSEHPNQPISIMEIGLGTGLNAFISLLEAEKEGFQINYTGIEGYPVSAKEVKDLNFAGDSGNNKNREFFKTIHELPWEVISQVTSNFSLLKKKQFFEEIEEPAIYDLVYFDAFGARVQPDLWTEKIFRLMYDSLKPGGVLVTYSSKGSARRAMQAMGFVVEKLPGPPGKREMLRARRPL